jgi:hypothetical protein
MRKRHFQIVLLALLAAGSVLAAASPALAEHASNGFQKGEYEVVEAAGYVELAVFVKFVPVGQGQIDYYTSDLTAVAGRDYQQTSGTVTFITGTYGRQDIKVPINDDELIEGEERFEVKLTNFRGSFVDRGHETALVRILDDDSKVSSGGSAYGQSKQQTAGSQPRSSSGLPSTSAVTTSPGPSAAGDQPGEVTVDDSAPPSELVSRDEARPLVGTVERNDNRPTSLFPASLGAFLLVTLAAAELGLKKRLRRRWIANP